MGQAPALQVIGSVYMQYAAPRTNGACAWITSIYIELHTQPKTHGLFEGSLFQSQLWLLPKRCCTCECFKKMLTMAIDSAAASEQTIYTSTYQ